MDDEFLDPAELPHEVLVVDPADLPRRKTRKKERGIPPEVAGAIDRIEVALWLGSRVRRFGELTDHPLFPEIYGRLVTGSSPFRLARWVQERVPPDDVLGSERLGFTALYNRLWRFRRLLPEGVLLARGYLDEKFRTLDGGIDVLAELDIEIRFQKQRIEAHADLEKNLGLPLEQIGLEVDRLRRLLEARRDTMVALGLAGSRVPALTIDARQVHVTQVSGALSIETVIERNPARLPEILALFDKLEEIAEGDADQRSPVPVGE